MIPSTEASFWWAKLLHCICIRMRCISSDPDCNQLSVFLRACSPTMQPIIRTPCLICQALLADAPQLLFRSFPAWGSPLLASSAEQRALALHTAVAALYDDHQRWACHDDHHR